MILHEHKRIKTGRMPGDVGQREKARMLEHPGTFFNPAGLAGGPARARAFKRQQRDRTRAILKSRTERMIADPEDH